jgi:gamma-glutamyltranspeptidase/glutathione hydrolase
VSLIVARFVSSAVLALGLLVAGATATPLAFESLPSPSQPVMARSGLVSTDEAHASRIGVEVLEKGGNAVDAAVAVGFALAVTHPQAGNLGGGGFMLIHLARRSETIAIDYRETAPEAVNRHTFLDERGEADPRKSRDTALAVGVPGTVAGLALAHERYGSGRFTLAELIAPAIRLAREGITVEEPLADALSRAQTRLARWPSSRIIFLEPDGTALKPGSILRQPDLAASLELIARGGTRMFYDGPIGEKIAASVRAAGGLLTLDDLRRYRAILRPPVHGTYRGYRVVSMPPPSSGGIALIAMLNILERFPLARLDPGLRAHVVIEAMKLAYADRAAFLADPDAVEVPVERLTSKSYAVELASGIDLNRARPATEIPAATLLAPEGPNTTHFSVVDRFGNAVANTTTLNFNFGLGLTAEGTGILLNNELDDFAAKPGAPNAYGLVGGSANAPGPGKRPLSSMAPTIVLNNGAVYLVTGSPGGSRIITTVLQVLINILDLNMNIAEAVSAPRLHHQWLPDHVNAEDTVSPELLRFLRGRGHHIVTRPSWGAANSILVDGAKLFGSADPRARGALAAGY